MATKIAPTFYHENFYSDIVLGEVLSSDLGFSTDKKTVTLTATMKLGSIVNDMGQEIATGAASSATGVIIWTDTNLFTAEVGSTITVVIARRTLTLNKKLLNFTDGAINDAGVTALTNRTLKITDNVIGE